jgi:hypothetical protein
MDNGLQRRIFNCHCRGRKHRLGACLHFGQGYQGQEAL